LIPPPSASPRSAPGSASLYAHHLFAARHLAELARDIEEHTQGVANPDVIRRHRAYVTSAVFAAAAFLESSINELYDELRGAPNRLPRRLLAVQTPFWSAEAAPAILHKYQLALLVADAEPYDGRRSPYRDVDSLLALRDTLMHGRGDRRTALGRRKGIELRLRAKFGENPLAAEAAPFFPDRVLGTGCAAWAVRVAERFSNEFCRRMAIPERVVPAPARLRDD
jgi:hypothetical protein